MIRIRLSLARFTILLLVLCAGSQQLNAQKQVLKTIIVDPGHGKGNGAKGQIAREEDIALGIGLKLGKRIETEMPEIKVLYTRTTEVDAGGSSNASVANRYRAQMANDARADLYISIHCNSTVQKAGGWYAKRVIGHKTKTVYVGKGSKRRKKTVKVPITESYYVKNTRKGTETYIWAADRSGIKSDFINMDDGEFATDSAADAAAPEMPDMNTPEARIRAQLYEKRFFTKSLTLATYVEEEFAKQGRQSAGVKQRNDKGIWVLQATGMPSVLVETGFLSNTEEEQYLVSEEGQNEVVDAIFQALKRYKDGSAAQPAATN
jgi:N-acetylmuramoyl-L-alanine amidase